jgi:hypothetical protein
MTARVMHTQCQCGQPFVVEWGWNGNTRTYGKHVYYPGERDKGWCAFRCRNCRRVVDENVPGAEYERATP